MGQKVNPTSFRLGTSAEWQVKWFSDAKAFPALLGEDVKIRDYLNQRLARAGVAKVHIERSKNQLTITIDAARPGVIIGRGGAGIDAIRIKLAKLSKAKVQLNIEEVHQPDLAARVVAETVATQLEKRIAFRRAIRQAMERVMKAGAQGVKIAVAGRLNGAEMARREVQHKGKVPLHTLRAGIDFGQVNARTTYGTIGVKVWIYTGEVGEYAEKTEDDKSYLVRPRSADARPA